MAIKHIEEKKDGKGCSWDLNGRSYSITLYVECDDPNDGPQSVITSLGLPPASTYRYPLTSAYTEQDLGSYLKNASVGGVSEDGLSYEVTLDYGPYEWGQDQAQGESVAAWVMAPWAARPSLKWGSTKEDFSCVRDRNGNPILNTIGRPFDPAITIPKSTLIATINRVEKSFNPAWITYYQDTVNVDEWMGWDAGSVLCQTIEADSYIDGDWGNLWNVTYTFAFKYPLVKSDKTVFPGWSAIVLNADKYQVTNPDWEIPEVPKLGRILDENKQPFSDPVPLQANGTYDQGAAPYYLVWDVFPEQDFSYFNFPADLFTAAVP